MVIILLINFTVPTEFPINDYFEYLHVRGFTEQNFIQPNSVRFITDEINRLLINDWMWKAADRHIISYFSRLIDKPEDFSYLLGLNGHYTLDDVYGGALDLRTAGKLNDFIGFSQALRISRTNIIDRAGPYPWKGFQAYISEGMLIFNPGPFGWEIGRRNLNLSWADNNSLILSPTGEGYDGVLMSINGSFYEFHSLFSILDASDNKFLTLHRLALKVRNSINIGFTEALLFSGNFEPLYMNPFVPYYLAQWGVGRDDNIMWLLDARIRIFKSYISGELLIDDYMYESDPYPDKIAYRMQLKSFPVYPIMIKAVYTMVDKWVYTQRDEHNIYEHNGLPLGFPLGNDVDQIAIIIKYFSNRNIHPSLNIDFVRKGEGSIYLPFEEEDGDWQPPFPSGVVEKDLRLSGSIDLSILRLLYLRSSVGYQWLNNTDHQPGNNSENILFTANIWAFL